METRGEEMEERRDNILPSSCSFLSSNLKRADADINHNHQICVQLI